MKLWILASVCVLGFAGFFAWKTHNRLHELEAGMLAERQRAAKLTAQLGLEHQALERTRYDVRDAREEARRQAEAVVETEAQRQQAVEHAERTTREMAAIRARRDQELDRMQKALNKIAPTRRTASGMVVDLTNDSFFFDFGKSALRPENRETLSRIAGVLLASEGFRLFIYGHTDDVGPDAYNDELSRQRAASVAAYLHKAGVPQDLMAVEGFGKKNPRVENANSASRQKNRRVEIGIVDSIIDYNVPPA